MLVIALLVVLNGLALWGILRAVDQRSWVGVGVIAVCTALVDVVYATRRFIPGKYLLPGSIFLVLFAVFPVIYTVYLSFTNYGTGHLITKPQAIAQIEANSVQALPDATRYRADIMETPDGELYLLLTDPSGAYFTGQSGTLEPADPAQVQTNESGTVTGYDGATALTVIEKNDLSQDEKDALAVTTDTGLVQLTSLTEAAELEQRFQFDSDRDVMVDATNGVEYQPVDGRFINPDADPAALDPGWTVGIGFENYKELFTDPTLRDPFVSVFVWTMAFATLTVATQFALGMLLAMVFANERMKARGTYRVLLILPYALPTFMTILVWQGMMNTDFGILNEILNTNINWLGDPWWARFSVLLVNLWLRVPVLLPRLHGRAAEHSDGPQGGGVRRRRDRAEGVQEGHVPAAADRRGTRADLVVRLQLQQLQHHRAADGRRPAEAGPDRRPDGHPPHVHDDGRVRPGRERLWPGLPRSR